MQTSSSPVAPMLLLVPPSRPPILLLCLPNLHLQPSLLHLPPPSMLIHHHPTAAFCPFPRPMSPRSTSAMVLLHVPPPHPLLLQHTFTHPPPSTAYIHLSTQSSFLACPTPPLSSPHLLLAGILAPQAAKGTQWSPEAAAPSVVVAGGPCHFGYRPEWSRLPLVASVS